MNDVREFIKGELKKKGYSLENYVQSLLVSKKWRVQPHAYFLDKDTGKGRELDLKAFNDNFVSDHWRARFVLNLLVQCKKLPGNAWIFFSAPERPQHGIIEASNLAKSLNLPRFFWVFDKDGTHFDRSDMLATNYCEVITDETKSNKRVDNIWECVVSLIKATSQEFEQDDADNKQYFEEIGSYEEFIKNPFEMVSIYYPLIVFEGKMYECTFSGEDATVDERGYVSLFVDYESGRYKGQFHIDIITKERLPEYLENVTTDLAIFDQKRKNVSKEYEKLVFEALSGYFHKGTVLF